MTFLIVIFILFAIASIIAILSYFNYQTLAPSDIFPPPPSSVACSPDQVLTAWIWNVPNSDICPPYANQLVVSNANLYERNFMVDTTSGCCWFSKDEDARTLVPNAYILIGSKSGQSYTDDQLNQKPYAVSGQTIIYIVPVCDTNDDCFEMLQVGTAQVSGTSQSIGAYKISKYYDASTVNDPNTEDYIQNTVFYITDDGQTLVDMQYKGQSILNCNYPPSTPLVIQYITNLYCRGGRMFPISGVNSVGASSL